MRRREAGFTLVELMIALAIVTIVLYSAINFFIISVRQYKIQTKITETNVEGVLGLELFRQDLESIGYGLPWNGLVSYTELTTAGASADLLALNDSPNAPRAVVSLNGPAFTVNGSDYLAIKSAKVGMSDAAGKWTTLTQSNVKRIWTPAGENMANSDYVIVLALGSTDANRRSLVTSGTFYTQYGSTGGFVPIEPYSANIVYGIDNGVPARPFNRADYYIDNVSTPQRCAPNTGVLVKGVISQATGNPIRFPLVDCAADMKVVYGYDNNADGFLEWTDEISVVGATAADIRSKLGEVHVHVLAQEGQRDDAYRTPTDIIDVGSEGFLHHFDVSGYRNYRWKVYNIVVKPKNLAQ